MGFWVGLRARDFPTERVLSRTPLIIRTVDQNQMTRTWNTTQKPTSNRPEPGRTIQRLRTAPCPQALRSARDAWRAHGPSSEETADTTRIPRPRQGPQARSGTESYAHGHMYSDSLGAAAGFAPERSSLTGGVPSVSNAGVVGGVIHLAAVLRVAHVRLRRAMEHAVQRRVPAPRDLPETITMK